jgi:hypothetical protein
MEEPADPVVVLVGCGEGRDLADLAEYVIDGM